MAEILPRRRNTLYNQSLSKPEHVWWLYLVNGKPTASCNFQTVGVGLAATVSLVGFFHCMNGQEWFASFPVSLGFRIACPRPLYWEVIRWRDCTLKSYLLVCFHSNWSKTCSRGQGEYIWNVKSISPFTFYLLCRLPFHTTAMFILVKCRATNDVYSSFQLKQRWKTSLNKICICTIGQ